MSMKSDLSKIMNLFETIEIELVDETIITVPSKHLSLMEKGFSIGKGDDFIYKPYHVVIGVKPHVI